MGTLLTNCLVERWASGLMDHVHKKRVETINRRREAEALLGTPGVSKPPGSLSSLKRSQKNATSPKRIPNLLGLSGPSAVHHARKRSLVSGQLARLFDESPAPTGSTTPVAQPRHRVGLDKPGPADRRSSTSSDIEMSGVRPTSHRHSLTGQRKPRVEATLEHKGEKDDDLERIERSTVSSSSFSFDSQVAEQARAVGEVEEGRKNNSELTAIELAAPHRPYTRWRGE